MLDLISAFCVILVVLPAFMLWIAPMFFLYYRTQKVYRKTAREIKRLSSNARSPIFAHFNETINGLITMRAFGETARFQDKCGDNVNYFTRVIMCQATIGRWLSVRLQGLGAITLFWTSLAVTVFPDYLDAGLAGLAMNYSMQATGTLQGFISSFTELELKMNGIERVKYCEHSSYLRTSCVFNTFSVWSVAMQTRTRLRQRNHTRRMTRPRWTTRAGIWPLRQRTGRHVAVSSLKTFPRGTGPSWTWCADHERLCQCCVIGVVLQTGKSTFLTACLKHRCSTAATASAISSSFDGNDRTHWSLQVLDSVSFSVTPGQKVGVCGRTGSGKSSLMLTLFRVLELAGGSISIDGVNIASLGLAQLRKAIAMLPQVRTQRSPRISIMSLRVPYHSAWS